MIIVSIVQYNICATVKTLYMGCGHPLILRILTMGNPINGLMAHPFDTKTTHGLTEPCASEVAAPTALPGWGGYEVQARMGVNRKWQALNNYNVLAVCRGNVTLRIAVNKPHHAVAPCRVKRQWHTETAMSSELLPNYMSWKTVQREPLPTG